ncbi:hypothetical protein Syun_030650 [Stephania yunnanensis]|uniref:Uncharacterized protein n=1 Tax=Stephania yunnanensis TaxID=152371 RepID=A0AAP0DZ02_9MAGN
MNLVSTDVPMCTNVLVGTDNAANTDIHVSTHIPVAKPSCRDGISSLKRLPVKMEFLNLIEKRTVFVYHAEELNLKSKRDLLGICKNRIEDVMFQNACRDGHKINVGNSLAFILKCSLWSSAIILLVLAMVVVDLMLEALYPDVYRNVHEYGMGIDIAKGVFGIYQGASNHEELHNLMKATIMIRRLKKEVLSELPNICMEIIISVSDSVANQKQNQRQFFISVSDPLLIRDGSETEYKNSIADSVSD